MTSQPGKQTITIDILPNILGSKRNETRSVNKIHQKKYFSLKREAGRLVPDLFLSLTQTPTQLGGNFPRGGEGQCPDTLKLAYNKNKLYKTLEY